MAEEGKQREVVSRCSSCWTPITSLSLFYDKALGARLRQRLVDRKAQVFTTIVTAQEVTEGWCAFIRKQRAGSEPQIHGYREFQHSLEILMELTLLPFDEPAAEIARRLKKELPRLGTQDLKIAAICLAHDGMVLTRNLVDFHKIPGLRVENWLD